MESQQEVIEMAYKNANVNPSTITYIEAHGTGTSLGDPIEFEALSRVFKNKTKEKEFCKLGSVKSNIGHTVAAAGIAGLIKVVMMMKHQKIPATLHAEELNPVINFKDSSFKVAQQNSTWTTKHPYRAGLSSFGFGGVNGHLLVEHFKRKEDRIQEKKSAHLFVLSARSESSLKEILEKWKKFVLTNDFKELRLDDICNTLQNREAFAYRIGKVFYTKEELLLWIENSSFDITQCSQKPLHLHVDEAPAKNTTLEKVRDYVRSVSFNKSGIQAAFSFTGINPNKTAEKIKRPSLPLYNPLTKQFILKYKIDKNYLTELVNVSLPDNSSFFQTKAQQLFEVQYTFKNYMLEWRKVAKSKGLNLDEHELLELIAIMSSLEKLVKTWNLSREENISDPRFLELIFLLNNQILSKEDLIEIFLDTVSDWNEFVAKINTRLQAVSDFSDCPLLIAKNEYINEIDDFKQWVKQLESLDIDLNLPENTIKYSALKKESNWNGIQLLLWLHGQQITTKNTFRKVALPTYSFAKTQFPFGKTVDDMQEKSILHATHNQQTSNVNQLHPLLSENISTLYEQKFKLTVDASNYYLSDHIIQSKKLLVGVATLEMALQAAQKASHQKIRLIENVNWIRPLILQEGTRDMELKLIPKKNGVDFALMGDENTIYSQCHVSFEATNSSFENTQIEQIKLNAVHHQTGDSCYGVFAKRGFTYGKAFQVIQNIWTTEKEALSLLKLPALQEFDFDQYVLHPSLMDGALQTVLGLKADSSAVIVPFGMDSLEILHPLTQTCYAHVTTREHTERNQQIFDLKILDVGGKVLLAIKGFSVRVLQQEQSDELLVFNSEWKQQAIAEISKECQTILLIGDNIPVADALRNKGHLVKTRASKIDYQNTLLELKESNQFPDVVIYQSRNEESLFEDLLSLSKALIESNTGTTTQLLFLNQGGLYDSAAAGLLKSLSQESSKIIARTIYTDAHPENWIQKEIFELFTGEVRYINAKREIKVNQLSSAPAIATKSFRKGGVYLITGGAGGLGLIFATYLKEQYAAKLILVGRSALDEKRKKQVAKLGEEVIYIQSDITNEQQVDRIIAEAIATFGVLHGILHTAGIIRDSVITKKDVQEAKQVLAPKIQGTLLLDKATARLELDFFLLCSSIAATTGNSGQADYAYANAFMDAFAAQRKGKIVSINWPLWADGGMQVDEQTLEWLKTHWGMSPLSTKNGLQALEFCLMQSSSNIGVVEGNPNRLQRFFNELSLTKKVKIKPQVSSDKNIKGIVSNYLKTIFAAETNLGLSEIEDEKPFEKYGIDSLLINNLNVILEKKVGSLSRTLLFEYTNLGDLTDYFVSNHAENFVDKEDVNPEPKIIASERSYVNEIRLAPQTNRLKQAEESEVTDIAVIGLSGRYPQAKNIEAYWQNLISGRDCITEIPEERWNWKEYAQVFKEMGTSEAKWGGFIEDVDKFDPLFFGISPREAELMDPQERLFLQTVYHTLENAGYTASSIDRQTGVFVGVMWSDYQLYGAHQSADIELPTANHWSIANRISYFFNFNGPSIAIDTACSSSLTAIHQACESIKRGESKMAIAGGVNLSIHPNKFQVLSQQHFASSDGRCRSFGEGGDGYVPGEGVGAVLLKPLQQAIADGDQVYAVIKGSSVNHGGATNGFTVPNPNAQADLIKKALEHAAVDPRTISYIEAHGTGTSLGDPIEITGLTKAFSHYTKDKQFCAIGSSKSNIGHLEASAGIAGLTKLLLQLKYKTLVPSLHSEVINRNIRFENTPFYIQKELGTWNSNDTLRRGAISSFGAGGSNAHVIVEEFISVKKEITAAPVLIVLSAKSEERLRVYAGNIADDVLQNKNAITEIAYTLQVGREAQDWRLAFVAKSVEEIIIKLKDFSEGKQELNYGNSKKAKKTELVPEGDEGKEYIKTLLKEADLEKLEKLWMQGTKIDWKALYENCPQRISLATYPFEPKRYWFETTNAVHQKNSGQLHPLLTENISTIYEQKFKTILEAKEYYFSDHVIDHKKLLVGVVSLEMALQAGQKAANKKIKVIENVTWVSPLVLEEGTCELEIKLLPTQNGLEFKLKDAGDTVYSQCSVSFELKNNSFRKNDIEQIKTNADSVKTGADCYEVFTKRGFSYGKAFKVIQTLWVTEKEALSLLKLPASQGYNFDQYGLHPSILDGALQTVLGLKINSSELLVPFGIERLELLQPLTKDCYVHVRTRENTIDNQQRFDIQVLDLESRVLVDIVGFSARAMQAEQADELLLFTPEWRQQPVDAETKNNQTILILGTQEQIAKELVANGHHVTTKPGAVNYKNVLQDLKAGNQYPDIVIYTSSGENEQAFEELLSLSKSLIEENTGVSTQLIYLSKGSLYDLAASGLLKTLSQESSKIIARTVLADTQPEKWIAEEIKELFTGEVRYVNGRREIKINQLKPASPPMTGTAFREGAVYLITGGVGGLGLIFAKYLKTQYASKLVLVGRSALNDRQEKQVKELGQDVIYIQADITNEKQVKELIDETIIKFGSLHGILHAAGITRDSTIVKKDIQEARQVLDPKISGTLLLDKATEHLNLDFFLLCSSVAATMGNNGQADYAYANAFMDAFAAQRKSKTVSINWPLWDDGGMQVDIQTLEWMKKRWGMAALSTNNGLQALELCLAQESPTIGVVEGNANRLINYFDQLSISKKIKITESISTTDTQWHNKLENDLVAIVSSILKIDTLDIDTEEDMSGFGFDSITFTKFTNQLNKMYQLALSPVILFEYSSLASFRQYLVNNHATELSKYYKIPDPTKETIADHKIPSLLQSPRIGIQVKTELNSSYPNYVNEPVAIIGMHGRMPNSNDLNAFWTNLLENKDLISRIPADRWSNEHVSQWGGLIPDMDKFDAAFFNISPREAELMDPQQRIFIESVWKCIEDSGYSSKSLSGTNTGVFVGIATNDYFKLMDKNTLGKPHSSTGTAHSVVANRISYLLNLHGPSEPIDTACSSALVAIHKAVRAIQIGDCDLAIAGGVNALLAPGLFDTFGNAGMLSVDGSCKTFDSRANGYVRSEGVGTILLKPLSKAEADGDYIYGVIRGSSQNHGGHVNSITVPNPIAQAALLVNTYKKAGVSVEAVGYIEAHGTGTPLGDPIEINALKKAFAELYEQNGKIMRPGSIGIGAVKSNAGHLETAAGMAGMFKVLLALKHKIFPANIHFDKQNPYVNLEDSPFYIVAKNDEWKVKTDEQGKALPRIAGVSSFGFGGVNAHIIVEEYTVTRKTTQQSAQQLLVLSAKTEERLKVYAKELANFLEANVCSLADVAYTLQTGRVAMNYRLAFVTNTIEDTCEKLKEFSSTRSNASIFLSHDPISKEPNPKTGTDEINLDAVLKNRNLAIVGQCWVSGQVMDWNSVYSTLPNRIPLPTYPFERKRYWMEQAAPSKIEISNRNATVFLKQTWKQMPIVLENLSNEVETIVWIINEETIQYAQHLKTKYSNYKNRIIPIHELTSLYEKFNGNIALIDLSEISDAKTDVIVNWEKIKFYQQIIQQSKSLNIFYFTKDVHAFKNNHLHLNGAFMCGLLPVLDAEYGKVKVKTIDVHEMNALETILDKEWKANSSGSLCYRDGERYELGYQQIEKSFADTHDKWEKVKNKTFVITGGTGGIGLKLTQHLAKKGAKKFVLLGRNLLSVEKQRAIHELTEQGAQVNYLAVSLTDTVKLKSFFKEVEKEWGEIAGVIHCAGAMDNREPAFMNKTQSQMQAVFEPKTEGLKVLDEVLSPYNPAFFVLFSSISILPKLGIGASDYSVANNWMNFYANCQVAQGKKQFKSIIWPLWENTGMGKGESTAALKMGFLPLKSEKGMELLDQVIFGDYPAVILPCVVDPAVFDVNTLVKIDPTKIQHTTKVVNKTENIKASALNKRLLHVFADVLKLDESEIPMDANFAELGVDSILIASLVKRIEGELGISIEPSSFIEQPCINDFANYLRKNHTAFSENSSLEQALPKVTSELKEQVVRVISDELKIEKEEINTDVSFSELGMDPVVMALVAKRLKLEFDIHLETNAFRDYSNVDALINYIQQHQPITNESVIEKPTPENLTQNKVLANAYEPIAVIGMACQFPESPDKETFWKNLTNGKDCVTTVPDSRWKSKEFYSAEIKDGKSISKWGGFIKDIEEFDPLYFGISETNAIDIDPLQRKFLETCIQAVHDGGYDKKSLWDKKVGVFIGSRTSNYSQKLKRLQKNTILGIGQNYIAALASQVFNWRGPNLVVDTACSSSLVSIHLACQSLRSGESEIAVAGGVDILLDEKSYLALSQSGALSPDGKCFTFDEKANGFVPGEGCGIVLLKKMSDALAAGDKIYAVIDASAVNNDGNTMGATTPNPKAQKEVIREAIQKAKINPETIGLMEAHGTGTLIGDPIELKALTEIYAEYTSAKGYCAVGSVKTNIGHLLSAAGVAGFIKSVLSVYHKQLPPTLHCSIPNPRFNFRDSPFFPNMQCTEWKKEIHRAGMSSFGFGGTNAHVIVSDAHLKERYYPERMALAPVVFNKKRYWYTEKEVVKKEIVKNGMDTFFAFEKKILEKI